MTVGTACRSAVSRVRTATRADGAGESGLTRLIDLHGGTSAGDALIAVSLAGTLFFSVPVGEARGRVALYLLVTMAPFAVVAPVVGPALDRLRHGRRYALAGTLLGRAVLAWIMARAAGGLALYPAAFGVLVLSKAYGVTRSAVVPRVLPRPVTLVSANARLSLAGLATAAVVGPIGVAVNATVGYRWTLRLAAVVFTGAALLALRLPVHVDSGADSLPARGRTRAHAPEPVSPPPLRSAQPAVVLALRAAAALRALAGFLTLFLAFLLRTNGGGNRDIALLAASAAVGGLVGTGVGARLPARAPEALLATALAAATAACAVGAWAFSLPSALLVALVAALSGSIGKLALDAVIQQRVDESVRASAFARSETALQLAWVFGGGVGIALPLRGDLGLGIAATGLAVALVATLRSAHRQRPARRAQR